MQFESVEHGRHFQLLEGVLELEFHINDRAIMGAGYNPNNEAWYRVSACTIEAITKT